MSLVELMIVVVVIGILAAISAVGYQKYIGRARLSEATAMLAEFAAKEQLFFLENGQYLEAHSDGGGPFTPVYVSTTEAAVDFWPQNPTNVGFDSARTPAAVAPMPASWRALGIRPRWNQLFCTYLVNVGPPTGALIGTVGASLWQSPPNIPWFYALAVCNLGGQAGMPSAGPTNPVTTLILTHDSPAIQTMDEHQ